MVASDEAMQMLMVASLFLTDIKDMTTVLTAEVADVRAKNALTIAAALMRSPAPKEKL